MSKRKKKQQKRRKGKSLAQRTDKYHCYQNSVQAPEVDISLIDRVYKRRYGRRPLSLREDFCGTASFSCEWLKANRERVAFGIDLDPEPLAWAQKNNLAELNPEQASRIKLIEGNVLQVGCGRVDVTVGFNFSYYLFRTRVELGHYFDMARKSLHSEGLFFLDVYGGADAQRTMTEQRGCEGFTYIWDQNVFDPIRGQAINYIHFEFPDGSEMKRAFRYDWRLWSIPEIRELLAEAGFSASEVYWEGVDGDTGEGNDIFTKREKALDDPAWVSYVVGIP